MVFQKGNKLNPANTPEDFWKKVDIKGEDDCWEWLGGRNHHYGLFQMNMKVYRTHRLSYEFTYGSIPEGLYVLHSCNNPPCCNPKHLRLGTHIDNMKQMDKDGRRRCLILFGDESRHHKLTEKHVGEIKEKYSTGYYTQQQLAGEYNITQSNISHIITGKLWKQKRGYCYGFEPH